MCVRYSACSFTGTAAKRRRFSSSSDATSINTASSPSPTTYWFVPGPVMRPAFGASTTRTPRGTVRRPLLDRGPRHWEGAPTRGCDERPLAVLHPPGTGRNTMIATGDFKRGARILVDGEPYTIDEYTTQSPSARGA